MTGKGATSELVRTLLSHGFLLDVIQFGNGFDKSGQIVRGEPALSRTVFINPMLIINGVPYAKNARHKMHLAQYIAVVIVHQVCHILYDRLSPTAPPPTIYKNFMYSDFGDLVQRFLWGGSLEIIEPMTAKNLALSYAVEGLLIIRHGVRTLYKSVSWIKDLLSQRAIDASLDLSFPSGTQRDYYLFGMWELSPKHKHTLRGDQAPAPIGTYRF